MSSIQGGRIKGVIAAVVTPIDAAEEPDETALRAVTDYVISGGVHGIMTTGGTGEFTQFSRDERQRIVGTVVAEANGRVPVIAGTAACGTREAVSLTRDAEQAGADAAIVTAPYYFPLPEESLYRHYADLAEATSIPLFVYNNPLYTGNRLSPSLLARLAQLEPVIGVKQSSSDFGELVELIRLVGSSIAIMTGIDSHFYASLCVGGVGIFSTAACVIPREMVAIYEAESRGDHAVAREVHEQVQPLNRFLEYDPGYVAPCKAALELLGVPAGRPSRPLPDLDESAREEIARALVGLGYAVETSEVSHAVGPG